MQSSKTLPTKRQASQRPCGFHPADSLLDEMTFGNLIITVQANEKEITEEAVKKVFRESLERHLIDAQESLEDNMGEILKELHSLRKRK